MMSAREAHPEVKARAVRMVHQHVRELGSASQTSELVEKQLSSTPNTLRRWVARADIDDGQRDCVPTDIWRTCEAQGPEPEAAGTNGVGRRASLFFAGDSTPAAAGQDVHRRSGRRGLSRRVDLHRPDQRGLFGPARTNRRWNQGSRHVADQTLSDATVLPRCSPPRRPAVHRAPCAGRRSPVHRQPRWACDCEHGPVAGAGVPTGPAVAFASTCRRSSRRPPAAGRACSDRRGP